MRTYILGNGGYAQECFEQFALNGQMENFEGFLIMKNEKLVLINEEGVEPFGYRSEANFLIGTGHKTWKKMFIDHLLEYYPLNITHFPNWISYNTHISQTSTLGVGNIFNCFSLINANARVGNFNLFNTYSCIHHDVRLGSYNTLSPYAAVLGYCNVGNHNTLGPAAVMTRRTNIGDDNHLSSGEHLFEDMSDRQFFKGGVVTNKPSKI